MNNTQPTPQTTDTTLISLGDLIQTRDPEELQVFLESFQCRRNNDVQTFLHEKSLQVENSGKGRTYLVVTTSSIEDPDTKLDVVGYFTISLKHVIVTSQVSKTLHKKMHGSSLPDKDPYVVVGYLIGQLAKNDNTVEQMPGSAILNAALSKIDQIKREVGGRFVIVECERVQKLIDFYENNGFKHLQDDPTDNMAQFVYLL